MIVLPDLLARLQDQATGCVAVLLVDLLDGSVKGSCGEEATSLEALADVMCDLVAPQFVILPQIPAPACTRVPAEAILLGDDRTYVCRRTDDPPHHAVAAVCRGTRGVGLIAGLLHSELASKDGR